MLYIKKSPQHQSDQVCGKYHLTLIHVPANEEAYHLGNQAHVHQVYGQQQHQ